MNAQELIKVLRKLVKEEVQKTVAEEVNKSMTRLLAEVINGRGSAHTEKSFVSEHVESDPAPVPQKHYVKNNRLNEALNATVPSVRNTDPGSRVSLAEMFSKVGETERVVAEQHQSEEKIDTSTNIGMLKSIVSKDPVGQQTSVLDHVSSTPIASVFKKDFRALMRKMDEKKNNNSGGFFAGAIPMVPQRGGYDQH